MSGVKLEALRPLDGDYGKVAPGDEFTALEAVAKSLIERGLAVAVEAKRPAKAKRKAA